jgi:hypothetical protein
MGSPACRGQRSGSRLSDHQYAVRSGVGTRRWFFWGRTLIVAN